jgi:hypothetical protein
MTIHLAQWGRWGLSSVNESRLIISIKPASIAAGMHFERNSLDTLALHLRNSVHEIKHPARS